MCFHLLSNKFRSSKSWQLKTRPGTQKLDSQCFPFLLILKNHLGGLVNTQVLFVEILIKMALSRGQKQVVLRISPVNLMINRVRKLGSFLNLFYSECNSCTSSSSNSINWEFVGSRFWFRFWFSGSEVGLQTACQRSSQAMLTLWSICFVYLGSCWLQTEEKDELISRHYISCCGWWHGSEVIRRGTDSSEDGAWNDGFLPTNNRNSRHL